MIDFSAATLTRQAYKPRPAGVWLECTGCPRNDVIVGSNTDAWVAAPDHDVAGVFRRHGWTGKGDAMKAPLCPKCSNAAPAGAVNEETTDA